MSDDWKQKYDEHKRARDERLAKFNFRKVFLVGGQFASEATACDKCGATIVLTLPKDGETHPLDLHVAWHKGLAT